jgi:hypothetical protein
METKTSLLQVFSLAGLLAMVRLEFLRPLLLLHYAETWRWKRFDCIAMLKLTIFRIIKRKDCCGVIRYLGLYPEQARLLGFPTKLPSPKTVWHWEKVRIGTSGFRELFNETVWHIKTLLQTVGIMLARIMGIDSTPLVACRNDKDQLVDFHPHYKKYMYKTDTATCGETGIPVDYGVSWSLGYDGHKLPEVWNRITGLLKQKPEVLVGDCHYNDFANQLFAYQNGFRLVGGFEENHQPDEKGTVEYLLQEYKKHWLDGEYIPPPVNFLHVLRVLARLEPELVGRYFKNQAFLAKDTDEYKALKGRRSLEESLHSILKDHQGFERLREKGRKNAELHIAMHHLALLITSPLALLQQGETKNLMRYSHYEP